MTMRFSFVTSLALLSGIWLAHFASPSAADAERWKREGWRTGFSEASVALDEIRSGGPPRDGIPPIDDPKFIPAADEREIGEREPVIALGLEGEARAYPLRILIWHEIVNDTVAGVPVAVTYCPLCNASIVFDRRIDGKTLTFGTTGKLRHSDLVMYDRQTESWWQQFTGEAIVGELTDTRLKLIPSRIMSFGQFKQVHPEGEALVPNDPSFRDYGRNPYAYYDSSAALFLYRGDLPDDLSPMSYVVIVRREGEPIIVTLERVRDGGFAKDGYRIEWRAGVASALDKTSIAEGRDIGTVRVVKDGADVAHDITFAFVAHAFHPDAPIAR